MNDPLDRRLADALHAEAGFDPDPGDALARFDDRRRQQRRRAQALAAVAASLLVIVGGVAVAARTGQSSKTVRAAGRPTPTSEEPQAGAEATEAPTSTNPGH